MSHLQAEVNTTYSRLSKLFGTYTTTDGYKTDYEWAVETPYGIARIYNYKDGKNYNGEEGLTKSKIRDWHIGGDNKESADFVIDLILNF